MVKGLFGGCHYEKAEMRRQWSLLDYPIGAHYNTIMASPAQENWPQDTLLCVGVRRLSFLRGDETTSARLPTKLYHPQVRVAFEIGQ